MLLNFVAHDAIAIDARPGSVWPYILDLTAWKIGPRLVHVSGSGGSGEVFAAMDGNPQAALYFARNVELVTNERRTLKLFKRDECELIGFASWALREKNATTMVTYDVFAQYTAPSGGIGGADTQNREAAEAQYTAGQRIRFKQELELLKQLVESKATRRSSNGNVGVEGEGERR